ncbi:hypothetical protein [Streptomyces bobili]|uniref:hypothetical protein n=1 Tax=Streptomyces bobili TaxID=67280 RepID=UPI003790592A
MGETKPGADELRVRALLIAREVGPDATPPKPTERPTDWLDDIIATDIAPTVEEPAEPEPEKPAAPAAPTKAKPRPAKTPPKRKPKKRKRPKPGTPRAAFDDRPPSPRQSLADAWDRVPYRLKWLTYHATAAYLGWTIGLVNWATYVTAWIAHTSPVGGQALFWYATAGGTVLLYRRTRGWWLPAAWLAAVPVTSTVVGVLLYGTPTL